ncbi:hypothetical protein [Algivirga pacifica]|uniref:Uncharacterized protein n=1 Tax=Algivirga pacifica TaxID=1162670 RepID=A0ABP9D3H4_9BACT
MAIDQQQASTLFCELGEEFVKVPNPNYVFPPYEIYALAKSKKEGLSELKAVVMDMDGTTTTTEELCIYSLEYMVRRMRGHLSKEAWEGLVEKDYPNIIGNSTTKHVEYLIDTYGDAFVEDEIQEGFLYAAAWTLALGKDEKRKEEVKLTLKKLGLQGFEDQDWRSLLALSKVEQIEILKQKFGGRMLPMDRALQLSVAIDIYYQKYHELLVEISQGNAEQVRKEVFGEGHTGKHLIEPMKGIGVLLPMMKGWLGKDIEALLPKFFEESALSLTEEEKQLATEKLIAYSVQFEQQPLKVGLVTSSIFYEADIVIREVFAVLQEWIETTALPQDKKTFIQQQLKDYHKVYDTFVTASDSSEIRLKPHRDLYSIALYQLGIAPEDFDKVAGFEDSQSGTIAIRAAGIGLCIAVPFAQTAGHDLGAATFVCSGGVPEVLLKHHLFLN